MMRYTLSTALALLLLLASGLLLIGYAINAPRVERWFITGDNLFILSAGMAALFALLPDRQRPAPPAAPEQPPSVRADAAITVAVVGVSLMGALLRLAAPGSPLLTWGIVPFWLFIVPGWSAARLLLDRTGLQLAFAAPLSVAVQMIGVMWLAWLDIPLTVSVLLLINGGVTAICTALYAFQRVNSAR